MDLNWRRSSRSGTGGGNCVEVATHASGLVAVRDSKDPAGPLLSVTPTQWRAFVSTLRAA